MLFYQYSKQICMFCCVTICLTIEHAFAIVTSQASMHMLVYFAFFVLFTSNNDTICFSIISKRWNQLLYHCIEQMYMRVSRHLASLHICLYLFKSNARVSAHYFKTMHMCSYHVSCPKFGHVCFICIFKQLHMSLYHRFKYLN